MELKGTNGVLIAYDDYVEISRKSLGGFITQGNKGNKKFFYKDLISIEYKKPSKLANGYIQFVVNPEMATSQSVGITGQTNLDASKDPNAVILRAFKKSFAKETEEFYRYVDKRLSYYKTETDRKPTEINDLRNLKSLLDDGIITQEEFNSKKKQILGI
ncbi:hypothetical protein FC84_GL001685 [Lapidilactobacillus dextrinicus DSM 20335]|uniref:SHOCT domain-containing protein n=1 Tax=Lapidilactobacillus dextrinicus DSM 20335 TaxID=1423738 RepID=A0A0R2BK52_9LACO|nr:SHOCT domain-containing protein [Lapidilactobacillus dextrinicus]KRM79504.1 hypothetical protein FC84_GL001685 [Lapidilactobacillus dextrinicus DSM 20335]QFG47596.1 SHOCT domain-containing protein [Lapidilactobacillus dextrinicus]